MLRAGEINDGVRITQGHIFTQSNHAGFRVWSNALKSGSQTNHYTLYGMNNRDNQIRVKLEGEGAHSETENGIQIETENTSASFNLVIDGRQQVIPDRYVMQVSGATLGDNVGDISATESRTVEIMAAAPLYVKHTLISASSSFSPDMKAGTLLAKGEVSSNDRSPNMFAVQFSANTCQKLDKSGFQCQLQGEIIPPIN